jgi:TPR repeat protein
MGPIRIGSASLSPIAITLVLFSGPVSAGALDDARAAFAKEDFAAGMAKFQEAADRGDPEALATLGTMYFYGIGVPFDQNKAFELNQKAAEQGRVEAQYLLSQEYIGRSNKDPDRPSREQKIAEAVKLLRAAEAGAVAKAEAGDPIAQWILGELYLNPRSKLTEGEGKALTWLTRAAEQNIACAQVSLAHLYESGHKVKPDPEKALELYRKAAQVGHAGAEFTLAERLQKSGNNEESEVLYAKAAIKGDPVASALLKRYYNIELGDPTAFYRQQAEMDQRKLQQDLGRLGGGSAAFSYGAGAAMMGLLTAGGGAGPAGSSPSTGRNPTNELVDRMRADQSQRDRDYAAAQRRAWEESNRRMMDDLRRSQQPYNQQHR